MPVSPASAAAGVARGLSCVSKPAALSGLPPSPTTQLPRPPASAPLVGVLPGPVLLTFSVQALRILPAPVRREAPPIKSGACAAPRASLRSVAQLHGACGRTSGGLYPPSPSRCGRPPSRSSVHNKSRRAPTSALSIFSQRPHRATSPSGRAPQLILSSSQRVLTRLRVSGSRLR